MRLYRKFAPVIALLPIFFFVGTPTASAVCVANQYIQVWSCAINVKGGACYKWYSYYTNRYNAACPSVPVGNQYVYNRYQFS